MDVGKWIGDIFSIKAMYFDLVIEHGHGKRIKFEIDEKTVHEAIHYINVCMSVCHFVTPVSGFV